jgi:hypothetical protein
MELAIMAAGRGGDNMGLLTNIAIGLLTALIGYSLGRIWQRLADQIPLRRTRRPWGPLLAGELQIVVSRFWPAGWRGPTGVAGGGDTLALRELGSYFSKIGSRFDAVYVDEAHLDRKMNLILLGGPDTNSVTRDALALIRPRVRIFDPGPGKVMEIHDLAAVPALDQAVKGKRPTVQKYRSQPDKIDYGIIICARNPFDPTNSLIIIAGAYRYGTWGGASLATEDWFLKTCQELDPKDSGVTAKRVPRYIGLPSGRLSELLVRPLKQSQWTQFECIFSVSIYNKRPHAPEIIALRPRA